MITTTRSIREENETIPLNEALTKIIQIRQEIMRKTRMSTKKTKHWPHRLAGLMETRSGIATIKPKKNKDLMKAIWEQYEVTMRM